MKTIPISPGFDAQLQKGSAGAYKAVSNIIEAATKSGKLDNLSLETSEGDALIKSGIETLYKGELNNITSVVPHSNPPQSYYQNIMAKINPNYQYKA
jgi:hypothetical protein